MLLGSRIFQSMLTTTAAPDLAAAAPAPGTSRLGLASMAARATRSLSSACALCSESISMGKKRNWVGIALKEAWRWERGGQNVGWGAQSSIVEARECSRVTAGFVSRMVV